jgi:hypothetical protein
LAAAASITVLDADLQPGGRSVQLTVEVTCDAPAGSTAYLSATLWQGNYLRPEQPRYVEGQGQTSIVCDGAAHTYSLTTTTTIFYADKRFKPGRAMTESAVQYCVRVDETTAECTPIFPLIRQPTRIR